jgi:hypothetical protein
MNGENDDFLFGVTLQNTPTCFDTTDTRHIDVHQNHIGLKLLRQLNTFFTAIGFTDDANLPAIFQQTSNAGSYQLVVIG